MSGTVTRNSPKTHKEGSLIKQVTTEERGAKLFIQISSQRKSQCKGSEAGAYLVCLCVWVDRGNQWKNRRHQHQRTNKEFLDHVHACAAGEFVCVGIDRERPMI